MTLLGAAGLKVVVIGSKPFVSGFRLSGVNGIEVNSPNELLREFERMVNSGDVALIILEEELSKHVRDAVSRVRITRAVPLVYELSGVKGESEKIDYRATLRRILGV